MNGFQSKGFVIKPEITGENKNIQLSEIMTKMLYDTPTAANGFSTLGIKDAKQIFSKEFLEYGPQALTRPNRQLGSTGSIFTGDFTASIERVIRAITPNVTPDWSLSKSFPVTTVPTEKIYVERVSHIYGLTQDYSFGSEVPPVQKLDSLVFEFTPPPRREQIVINEQELTFWRKYGTMDTPGALNRIAYNLELLMGRMFNRLKYDTIQSIYNGGFTYNNKTITYGLDSAKRVVPVGAKWATGSPGSYVINQSANPLLDIFYWLGGSTAAFNKYLGLIKRMVMNPNTAQWVLANTNTRTFIGQAFANEKFLNDQNPNNVERIIKFFIPGFNIEVDVEYQGYLTSQSDGNSFVFFIPDGYIFFDLNAEGQTGGPLGEYQMTAAVQNGGWANPQPGPFLQVEDCTFSGARGGIGRPFVNLVSGFTGALNLQQPDNILSAVVV